VIRFGPETLSNLDLALDREWLETNGLGGYASSTISGANTRVYHGLLVAALKPPVARMVLLSKMEETLLFRGGRIDLSVNLYPGAVHPAGHLLLDEFRLDAGPVWRWNVRGLLIEKAIRIVNGSNAVEIEYRLLTRTADPVQLGVRPLIAFRDYHATTHENPVLNRAVAVEDQRVSVQPYSDLPSLAFTHNSNLVTPSGRWYYRFQYPRERERGLTCEEDLFEPFSLLFDLGDPALISASIPGGSPRPEETPASAELVPALSRAAGQFIVKRGDSKTIIAGYHWFTDWGRDAMISLPGLTLTTRRFGEARQILLTFLAALFEGLLPNRFTDETDEPEYNASDATLWAVVAMHEYLRASGDHDFLRAHALPAVENIIRWREHGTRFNIQLDDDGLLTGGADGVQLSWMDAKVQGRVITERKGKPVEIQALWYNTLRIAANWANQLDEHDLAEKWTVIADRAIASFQAKFWNETEGCLFDVIDGDARDASIRPNQVLALGLPYPLLDSRRGASVLNVVQRELLTPFGLRTLSPRDPNYRGRYEGDPVERDGAYHQGTVWPWLLGPYVRAVIAVHGHADVERFLEPFRGHLLQAGLGQVSEIFDGDLPHTPRGCIAQAWSVAELLRISALRA
jgi:glycogen debranching enzyme